MGLTSKTTELLKMLDTALKANGALLLTGSSGVGKTFLAKQLFDNMNADFQVVSCHSGLSYEDIVGGITPVASKKKLRFEYREKCLISAMRDAAAAPNQAFGIILDDINRSELMTLLGDAAAAVGAAGMKKSIKLNSGSTIDVPQNFYIIATYNDTELSASPLSTEVLSGFHTVHIYSDIEYITDDNQSENYRLYEIAKRIVMSSLSEQSRSGVLDAKSYIPGHGFFTGRYPEHQVRYRLVPILRQYVKEEILDKSAEVQINALENACLKQISAVKFPPAFSIFSGYTQCQQLSVYVNQLNIGKAELQRAEAYFTANGTLENTKENTHKILFKMLIGRIIHQKLITEDDILNNLLFNPDVIYRKKTVNGTEYTAAILATDIEASIFRRNNGRSFYNGGEFYVSGKKYNFTGGIHAVDYSNSGKQRTDCWETLSANIFYVNLIKCYYENYIKNIDDAISINPTNDAYAKLKDYAEKDWESFYTAYKKITPQKSNLIGQQKGNEESLFNRRANCELFECITKLKVLWTDADTPLTDDSGQTIKDNSGNDVKLERLWKTMNTNIYDEYANVMDALGIRQMILQGPPGTSKTYTAKQFLKHIAGDCDDKALADIQITDYTSNTNYCKNVSANAAWDIVQFHPSYGYEDFIRGIQVSTGTGKSGSISYDTVNKVLGNIAALALKFPDKKFYLVIDEINRANLASVFSELIYALEYRTEGVATPYTVDKSNKITLPDNLYIIGTMNTADKSIGGIDYAIRRRFLFFEMLPDIDVIRNYCLSGGAAQQSVNDASCRLFEHIAKIFTDNLSPEYRCEDVQLGHTYFLVGDTDTLFYRFAYQMLPILKEYYKDGIISVDSGSALGDFISGRKSISSAYDELRDIFDKLISAPAAPIAPAASAPTV